jgi:hypothetical protein
MPTVTLDYFSAAYNKRNQKTVVTNVKNLQNDGFVIKVGDPDNSDADIDSDLITVINKVKPDAVVLAEEDTKAQAFCEMIKIPCTVLEYDEYDEDTDFEPTDVEDLLLDESDEYGE